MWEKEAAVKNDAVWLCEPVIRTMLQNELVKYQQFLISDFTQGELPIEFVEEKKPPKAHPVLDGIIIFITAALSMWKWFFIGPIVAAFYSKKGKDDQWVYLMILQIILFIIFYKKLLLAKWIYIVAGAVEFIAVAMFSPDDKK